MQSTRGFESANKWIAKTSKHADADKLLYARVKDWKNLIRGDLDSYTSDIKDHPIKKPTSVPNAT